MHASQAAALIAAPETGWRRVLHKIWFSVYSLLLVGTLISFIYELHDMHLRRAADVRMNAIPRGADLEKVSDSDLQRIANGKAPIELALTVGDYYHAGDSKSVNEMANLPGFEAWIADWKMVEYSGTKFHWDIPLTLASFSFFCLLLRVWLGWLTR